ncbi:hypothetical protein HQ37_07380 [Porphyromonas sp. COT-239 OH1446]|nr:hypothetical protein HQ37_07380 [Porphyromonas sp. COT-239 OH1446]
MSILATLALMAAALVSCDKDDPKPEPQPLDPSYLPGKTFIYKEVVGKDSKVLRITFPSGTDRTFHGMRQLVIDKPGADFSMLAEGYDGIYTTRGNKITAKLRSLSREKVVGNSNAVREDFSYKAGQEPILFEGEVDAAQGKITLRAWDETIVIKLVTY